MSVVVPAINFLLMLICIGAALRATACARASARQQRSRRQRTALEASTRRRVRAEVQPILDTLALQQDYLELVAKLLRRVLRKGAGAGSDAPEAPPSDPA